jgi:hypothetical protein
MTLHIFHSINVIKQIKELPPLTDDQHIHFKFSKPGYNKLLIFDLDETLIYSLRDKDDLPEEEEDEEDGGETGDNGVGDEELKITDDDNRAFTENLEGFE